MDDKGKIAGAVEEASFEFTFNGKQVVAHSGDTIASALVRDGVYVFSRSMKFHRPRGYYCGSGRCISCVMRVNGVPGVRTCVIPASKGMVVETERGFPSAAHDILSIFDHIFRHEFDYQHRFIRPTFLTPFYQMLIRRLASSSRLPDVEAPDSGPPERRICDVLIVGCGVSGSVAHARLRDAGVRSMIIVDNRSGEDNLSPSTAFGVFEGGEVGVSIGSRIQLVKAKAILMATGRHETGFPLVNGDLPGVMLPEAVHQLVSRGVRAGSRAVLVGKNDVRERTERALRGQGTSIVATYDDFNSVVRVLGGRHVRGVEVIDSDGRIRRVQCDLVVIFGLLIPSVELAQQAGCRLDAVDGSWRVRSGADGKTSVPGIYASGGVTGLVGGEDRIVSGEVAAAAIIKFVGRS